MIDNQKSPHKLICILIDRGKNNTQDVVDGLFLLTCTQSDISFRYYISNNSPEIISLVMITVFDIFFRELFQTSNLHDVIFKLIQLHNVDLSNIKIILDELKPLSNPFTQGIIRYLQPQTLDLKLFHNEMFFINRQINSIDMFKYLSINNSNVLPKTLSKFTIIDLKTYITDFQDNYSQNTILYCHNKESFLNLVTKS